MAKGNKKNSLDFTVNVGIITKSNQQVDDYVKKLREIKETVGNRLAANFLDGAISQIKTAQKEFTGFARTINNTKLGSKERFAGIDSASKSFAKLGNVIKNMDKNWLEHAQVNNKKFLKQLDEIQKKRKDLSTQKGNVTRAKNSSKKSEDALAAMGYEGGYGKADIEKINKKMQKVKSKIVDNKNKGILDNTALEAELKTLQEMKKEVNNIMTQRNNLKKYYDQIEGITTMDGKKGTRDIDTGERRVNKKYEELSAQTESLEVIEKVNAALEAEGKKYHEVAISAEAMNQTLAKEFRSAQHEAEELKETGQTLKQIFAQFGIGFSASQIVNNFTQMIKSAYDFYKSLDAALNEIYVVSDLSSNAVNNLKDNFIGMAEETGMALDDVTRAATLFYQQGLSTDEVLEMTEVTAQFAKVAGIDATDAANKLTAAVNGYCLSAEDASLVADKFNKVAAASAADIDELSTAFSKAAAQANQAGIGMDNYLAYIATMVEATREAPENIGTSLKTIMARMQQVKEAGTTEDDDTDVNKVETALESVGVALRDANGELRDLEDVLGELGPKWNSLDRNTQAYIGTIIAGTRQQSRFITLMQNWDRVLELSEESAASAGQQAIMHAKAMESITSKEQQFKVALQEFTSNLANSDVIKVALELITKLVKAFNSGDMPVRLLTTGLLLFRKQLAGGLGALGKWIGSQMKWTKYLGTTNKMLAKSSKGLKGFIGSFGLRGKAIANNAKEIDKLNVSIDAYQKKIDTNMNNIGVANRFGRADIIKRETEEMEANEVVMGRLITRRQELDDANAAIVASMTGLINAGMTITTIFQGMATSENRVVAGIGKIGSAIAGAITVVVAFGVAYVTAMKAASAATAELRNKLISTGIGALIVGLGMLISLIVQAVEAFTVSTTDISESIQAVGKALQEYSTKQTIATGMKETLKEYKELSNQVYRTASEQEKLNKLAQQLGDSLDIEAVEDQYGNLTVSVEEAAEAIERLQGEADIAKQAFIDEELAAIEKYDHKGDKYMKDFYDGYIKAYRSDIRNVMGTIDTGIDPNELRTDTRTVETLMTSLKNTIINDTNEIAEAFGGLGDNWTLTQQVEEMYKLFEDSDISSDQWNELFMTFDTMQDNINALSYEDAFAMVESAIKRWGEAAGFTTEQINIMQEAIMSSLYGNSEYFKIMQEYEKKLAQTEEDYYDKKITSYKILKKESDDPDQRKYYQSRIDELEKEKKAYEDYLRYHKNLKDYEGKEGYDSQREFWKKEINRLEKEYGFLTPEEKADLQLMYDVLKEFNSVGGSFMSEIGMFDEDSKQLLEYMNTHKKKGQDKTDLERLHEVFKGGDLKSGRRWMSNYLAEVINSTDDPELKKIAQERLNDIFDNIQISAIATWKDVGKALDTATSPLLKMNEIMEEFNENGGLTLDTFIELCDVLGDIDLESLFDVEMMEEYIMAIQNLKLGFDESTGLITANGKAMNTLQDVMMSFAQAKLAQTAASLRADKEALQSQIWTIEAEIEANQGLIDYLNSITDETVSLDQIKEAGNIAYANTMGQVATLVGGLYEDMTTASAVWATAAINNAIQVGDAYKKVLAGELTQEAFNTYLENLTTKFDYTTTGSYQQILLLKPTEGDKYDKQAVIDALTKYNDKGKETLKILYARMKMLGETADLLEKMSKSDLSKLGLDPEKLKEYIGQLEEIYNTLRKIEGVQSRLDHLDSFLDIVQGEDKGKYLFERIKLSGGLVDDSADLVKKQKYIEQTEQNAIKGSKVGDVFTFDEYGNISLDYDKYKKLSNVAAEGEMSDMELADKLYEEYTKVHEESLDYYGDLIDAVQDAIDAQQEIVDTYIELENEVAEAVKESYQKMLDNKLEAIDAEIEALDNLREARDRANQAKQDSEELSNLQTSLKRSMMDTSGASNTKVLSYQDQIKDKLEQMGEDEYTRRLDAITEALEDEKEQLQRNFDEFFEDWEAFHDMIENRILSSEDATLEALRNTDEYKRASDAEKAEMEKKWRTDYATAITAPKANGVTIKDIQGSITGLENTIATKFDALLKNSADVVEVGTLLSRVLAEHSLNNKSDSGSTSTGSTSGGSTGGNSGDSYKNSNWKYDPTVKKPTVTDKEVEDKIKESEAERKAREKDEQDKKTYSGEFGKSIKKDDLVEFKPGNGKSVTAYNDKDGIKLSANYLDEEGEDIDWYYKDGPVWSDYYPTPAGTKGAWVVKMKKKGSSSVKWFPVSWNGFNEKAGRIWWYNDEKKVYKKGGLADYTGPAWLDGTKSEPEAVLNAAQTKAFMRLGRYLELAERTTGNVRNAYIDSDTPEVYIESIDFHVDNMSSVEDGKIAFDAFVDEFKRIGRRTGIAIERFKI